MKTNLLDAPCVFCGYSGQNYYQPYSHKKNCPWYEIGGAKKRKAALREVISGIVQESNFRPFREENGYFIFGE